jgi:hypothetical protein
VTSNAAAAAVAPTCALNGTGETCTGTAGGDRAWDPQLASGAGAMVGVTKRATVTVDQTSNLTNQMVHVSWTNFTPTFTSVNNVLTNSYNASGASFYGVSIFQCKGLTPADLSNDCNASFTNQGVSQNGVQPNGVEAFTQGGASTHFGDCTLSVGDTVCGTGFADFQVQTSVQNSQLGCDDKNPCSLVVEPNWGGNGSGGACTDHSQDYPNANNLNSGVNAQNNGDGWFNPCAWNDRIVVPLFFAKTPTSYCPASNSQFGSEGSPALERAMNQWRPAWCTSASSPLVFDYDSGVDEYQARSDFLNGGSALAESTDVALVNDPASAVQTSGSPRKFTYAPIVTTGIAIAYYVDNKTTGEPITNLVLNARLVAKLLTESYSLQFGHCTSSTEAQATNCDPADIGNPASIFQDPEFLALNPGYTAANFNFGPAANSGDFLPVVLAGNSDMTYELTRWIASDPDARAFLEGQPDGNGMHVNYYYQQQQTYPVSQFSVLDPGFTDPHPTVGKVSATMQIAWNPVSGLDNVASHLANWTSSGNNFFPACSVNGAQPPCPLVNPKNAPENLSQRTLFAVVDQGTAAAFHFPTAKLVNPAGNAVGPTIDSMSAAVGAMQANPDKITQFQNYSSTSPGAYPLTEVQYAMVPTCGLSQSKVTAVTTFLNDVAGSAQLYGPSLGELPPFGGYLALSDAQKAQTQAAVQQVSTQSCTSPPPNTTVSGQNPPPANGTGAHGNGGTASGDNGTGNGGGSATPGASAPATPGSVPSGASSTAPGKAGSQQPVGLGTKSGDNGSAGKTVLIAGLAFGGLLAIGGPLTYLLGTGAGARLPRRRRPGTGGGAGGDGAGGDGGAGSGGLDG